MKKLILIAVLMLCAVPAFAKCHAAVVAPAASPLSLSAGLEQSWSKLKWQDKEGHEYQARPQAVICGAYELTDCFYATGRFEYPFETKAVRYTVGIQVKLYGAK